MTTQKTKPKKFVSKLADRIETQIQERKITRRQKIGGALSRTTNIIFLLAAAALISFIWQQRIATPYLTWQGAIGKDFFNEYTFAKFIKENLPLPPTGWMPFWNQGIPIVGGYYTFFFYLIYPLTLFFDLATSLELSSAIFILLFLIFSHFLFWEISRNHLLSLFFTAILFLSPAAYNLFIIEGSLTSSATQMFLPLVLFFLIRFQKFKQKSLLLLAGIFAGIALLTHTTMALISTLIPSVIFILFYPEIIKKSRLKKNLSPNKLRSKIAKIKLNNLILFLLVSLSVGSVGIYSFTIQKNSLSFIQNCESPTCWGEYPKNLNLFSPLLLTPVLAFLPTSLIAWKIKKQKFGNTLALLIATSIPIIFSLLAYLKLINPLAGALPPNRVFWIITLLSLVSAASAFTFIKQSSKKLYTIANSLFFISLALLLPISPDSFTFNIENTIHGAYAQPINLDKYVIPKYQIFPQKDIIPSSIPINETNFRIDSLKPDFAIWWNTIAKMPTTRGFTNFPTKEHIDWQYYLQQSTNVKEIQTDIPDTILNNRTKYLLDAFAIKYLQQPSLKLLSDDIGYNPTLLADPDFAINKQSALSWTYFELNENLISPIISPTNAARILIISDPLGYESILRAISITNLNSQTLIPIQGPQSVDDIDQKLLDTVDAVILYQFTGSQWQNLEEFIASGGNLFIDIGSFEQLPPEFPDLFGVKTIQMFNQEKGWQLTQSPSPLLNNVNITKFAPLLFGKNPWRINAPPSKESLEPWMKSILFQKSIPILASGKFGKGLVTFSGFNLPYHALSYNNENESLLFENIISQFLPEKTNSGTFTVIRPKPNLINISTNNAQGILFKENYHSGWKAYINNKKAPIYKASLGFMYLPIPKEDWNKTNQISLQFRGNTITWGLTLLSFLATFATILYILTPRPYLYIKKLVRWHITLRLKSWWKKD